MRCSATPSAGMMSPLECVARVFFLFLIKRTGSENAVKRATRRLFRWFLHRGPVRRHSSMWFQAAAPQNPCLNFRCSTYFCSPSSRRRTRQVPDRAARNVLALHEAILVLVMHGARPGGTDLCPGLPGGAWEEPGLGRRTLAEGLFRAGEHPGLTSGWPGHDLLPEVSGTSQCVGVPKGPTSPPNGDICIDDCLILCIVTCIIMYSIILNLLTLFLFFFFPGCFSRFRTPPTCFLPSFSRWLSRLPQLGRRSLALTLAGLSDLHRTPHSVQHL